MYETFLVPVPMGIASGPTWCTPLVTPKRPPVSLRPPVRGLGSAQSSAPNRLTHVDGFDGFAGIGFGRSCVNGSRMNGLVGCDSI